jgi:hypothetical protein
MIKLFDFNIRLLRHLPGIKLPRRVVGKADCIDEILRTVIVNAGEDRTLLISCEADCNECSIASSVSDGKIDLDALDEILRDFAASVPNGTYIKVTVRDTVYSETLTIIPKA